ncbi:MAG: CotH kinase family protein [Kiritimatiellae bacterium]|nr:CotH kinase family protein [Kiritimatiellia bacterium]
MINEIHYHPLDDAFDSEFIELYNAGSSTVDLAAYRLDDGIEFTFPAGTTLGAGSYLVVCINPGDFGFVYPGITNCVGGYAGRLDNGGETVRLSRWDGVGWVTEDAVEYNDRGLWPSGPDGAGPSLELIHPGLPNAYPEAWLASTGQGTPGRVNSVYQSDPGPIITEVAHDPPLPFPGTPVTVTARVMGHHEGALTVTLRHRQDRNPPGSYASLAMADDGLHGDGAAGDAVYGAVAPGLSAGAVLDFQITARDSNGPLATAPSGAPAQTYLCYFGDDPYYTGEYVTYHMLMTAANRTELETRDVSSDVLLDGTLVVSDGRVFYNCGVRYRGSSARNYNPKSYRVELPRGWNIDGIDQLNFNAVNPILQHVGMEVFRNAGIPAARAQICRLWLNGTFLTQTGERWLDGLNGGVYVRMQKLDRDFIEENYPSESQDGNLYRGEGGALDWLGTAASAYTGLYTKVTNEAEADWSDIVDLCDVFNNTPDWNWPDGLSARLNWDEWITFFAVHIVLNNNETCIANTQAGDYFLYHDPADYQFDILPWDVDSVLDLSGHGALNSSGSPYAATVNKSVWMSALPAVAHFLRHPTIAPRFLGRVLDILDTTMAPSAYERTLDGIGSALTPAYRQDLLDSLAARRAFVRAELNFELTAALAAGSGGQALVSHGDTWRYFKGTTEPSAQWRTMQDWALGSAWGSGPGGFGYADGDDATVLADMLNSYASVYIRRTFQVPAGVSAQDRVQLVMDYDDGFVAYLNGVEIARRNAPGAAGSVPAHDAVATAGREAGESEVFDLGPVSAALGAGDNILAVHGLNAGLGSSDFSLIADLVAAAPEGAVRLVSGSDVALAGLAPQAHTVHVRVNGADADWDAYSGDWSQDSVSLAPGVNHVQVQAVDEAGAALDSVTLDIVRTDASTSKSGTIYSDTTWDSASGIVRVTGTVTVQPSATLTIAGNTAVVLDPGALIQVYGALDIAGTAGQPSYVLSSGTGSGWAIRAAGSGAALAIRHAELAGGALTLTNGATLVLEDSVVRDYDGYIVGGYDGADVTIRRCRFANFNETQYRNTSTLIEDSLFEYYTGDAIDCVDTVAYGHVIRRVTARYANGNSADGIDFEPVLNAVVENCLIHDVTDRGLSLGGGCTNVTVRGCVIYNGANNGIGVKDGAWANIYNCTIADCGVGLNLELDDGPGYGHAVATNLILWGNATSIRTEGDSTLSIRYSDVQQAAGVYAGTGNINADPRFKDASQRDYRLGAGSPCIGTGQAGADMGAWHPAGDVPAAPSGLALANGSPHDVALSWVDNSGNETAFEVERAGDGAAWSTLAVLGADATSYTDGPVQLGVPYSYRVRARHARGASLYSDVATVTPALSANTVALLAHLRVTELMYHPRDEVYDGDGENYEFVEFFNTGPAPLDLAGVTFADGIDYTFPAGTTLGAGQFFVLAADAFYFGQRYPGVAVGGAYGASGTKLSNSGERLRLLDRYGTPLITIEYSDEWYPPTDGQGYSLEAVSTDWDPSVASTWRASLNVDGTPGARHAGPFVVKGGLWKCHDQGVDLGTAWRGAHGQFDDSGWPAGNAPLGYGLADLDTTVSYGGDSADKHITTYFRYPFVIGADPADVTDLTLYAKYDDGFAAYLNGQEVARAGLPSGTISYGTLAVNHSAVAYEPFGLAPHIHKLVQGVNVLAVEMHQAAPTSSDLFIDMELRYTATAVELPPAPGSLQASALSPTTVKLMWLDHSANEDGFTIERSPDGSGGWVQAGSVGADINIFTDSGLAPDTAYTYRVRAYNEAGASAWCAAVQVQTLPQADNSIDVRVAASADDAEENLDTGAMSLTSSDLELVREGGTTGFDQAVGIRFRNLNIPPGATIVSAYLQFKTDETGSSGTSLTIQGQAADNAAAFSTASGDVTARLRTAAAISWSPPAWSTVGEAGAAQRTPNIAAVVQEIVNRPGWSSGGAMAFVMTGSGKRTADSYDGDAAGAPALHVEYSGGGNGNGSAVEVRVGASSDDAEENVTDGSMYLDSSDLELIREGYGAGYDQAVGIRFGGVAVPRGATIVNAYIQFKADEADTEATALTIAAHAADDAPTFAASAANITARSRTAASVAWNPPAWSTVGEAGAAQRTPNLASVVQELVNRSGWSSGNAMAFIMTGSGQRVAESYDGDSPGAPLLHVEYSTDASRVDVRVASSADDAEQNVGSGSVYLDSSDLELVYDGGDQAVGMRFASVAIPPGAAIQSAYVQFKVDELNSGTATLAIRGQASDDAAAFTTATGDITARPKTAAAVSWSPPAWTTVGAAGADQRTPDLAAVVQEIVDRPGWSSGNALVLLVTGSGERTAESYDGDPAGAPLLHVEFSGGPPPPPPPAEFTAYNDMAWFPGQLAGNITTYTTPNGTGGGANSGPLMDYDTGAPLGVTFTMTGGSGVYENQGLHPAAGTDAHAVFDGKVDGKGTASYGTTDVVMTFEGLDPALAYELVLYADRGSSRYVGSSSRWHAGILSGAGGYANASTPGTVVSSTYAPDDTTTYNAGYNNGNGYVTRFAGIDPGADGAFTVTLKRDSAQYVYTYVNALMLKATQPAGEPAAPGNLSATAMSTSSVALGWTDNSDNEDGFKIDRRQSGTSAWGRLTAGANATAYTDSGLPAGTLFYYKVMAYNSAGDSAYTAVAGATTLTAGPPAAPSDLTAASSSQTAIELRWTDNSDNEENFRVARSTDGVTYGYSVSVPADTTRYTDAGLAAGTTYYYRVRAEHASLGNSAYAGPVTAATPVHLETFTAYNDLAWFAGQRAANITAYTTTNGFPAAISNGYLRAYQTGQAVDVRLSVAGGDRPIETQGADPAAGTDAYSVFDGKVSCAGTLSYHTDDLTLTLSGLDPALEYELVLYCDRNGTSYVGASSRLHYGTISGAVYFENASSSGTTIVTDQTANDTAQYNAGYNNPYGYVTRFRKIAAGSDGQIVVTLKRDSAQMYYTYANALMLKATKPTVAPPAAPSSLTAQRMFGDSVYLTWRDNSGNEDGFQLERRAGRTAPWESVATVAPDSTTYWDNGVPTNRSLSYRVRAYNAAGASPYSNTATVERAAGDEPGDEPLTAAGSGPAPDSDLDVDGDGLSEADEFIAGTDASDPGDCFAVSIALVDGVPAVSFMTRAAAGPDYEGLTRYYCLEYKDAAVSDWTPVPACEKLLGTDQPVVYPVPAGGNDGPVLYRARVWLD